MLYISPPPAPPSPLSYLIGFLFCFFAAYVFFLLLVVCFCCCFLWTLSYSKISTLFIWLTVDILGVEKHDGEGGYCFLVVLCLYSGTVVRQWVTTEDDVVGLMEFWRERDVGRRDDDWLMNSLATSKRVILLLFFSRWSFCACVFCPS